VVAIQKSLVDPAWCATAHGAPEPITTGVHCPQRAAGCRAAKPRRMGPGVRRDDAWI